MIPKQLARTPIYENRWVSLYLDRVEYGDGTILEQHHVLHFDYHASAVVLENPEGEVLLIHSNRYVTQSESWEIPCGKMDPGETPAQTVRRETLEETGMQVEALQYWNSFYPSGGMSDEQIHLFYARSSGKPTADFDHREVKEIRWCSREEIRNMLRRREITCGISQNGLLHWLSGVFPFEEETT